MKTRKKAPPKITNEEHKRRMAIRKIVVDVQEWCAYVNAASRFKAGMLRPLPSPTHPTSPTVH